MLPGRHFLHPENRPKRKNENHRKFFQKLLDTGRFVWYIKQALRRRGRVVQSVRTLACPFSVATRGAKAPRDLYAAIAQPVERILGKDEVPGPNPGSSSIKIPVTTMATGIFHFMGGFCPFSKPLPKPLHRSLFRRVFHLKPLGKYLPLV